MNEPGAQGVGATEPVPHDEPAGQMLHWSANERLVEREYVPASHGTAAEAPRRPVTSEPSQKRPAMQRCGSTVFSGQ